MTATSGLCSPGPVDLTILGASCRTLLTKGWNGSSSGRYHPIPAESCRQVGCSRPARSRTARGDHHTASAPCDIHEPPADRRDQGHDFHGLQTLTPGWPLLSVHDAHAW